MLGRGNSGCLDCTAPALASLQSCTGIPAVKATPCVESAAISCSAAQQAATLEISVCDLSDDSDRCGHTTLALTGISPDKFTSLAGAVLVAVTAQLRHWLRCHHAQVSQPPKQLLALSPLPLKLCCGAGFYPVMSACDLCDDNGRCGRTALTLTGISHDKFDGCLLHWVRGIPKRLQAGMGVSQSTLVGAAADPVSTTVAAAFLEQRRDW